MPLSLNPAGDGKLGPAQPSGLPAGDDLSALAWVNAELRRTLESAHKSLRRFMKEADAIGRSDVDAADPAVLRAARAALHQGVGALEMISLPAAAQMLRASEMAVQRLAGKPALVNMAAVETLERSSFALLDFLSRQLAGKPVSSLMLFPAYRATQQLAGADRVHPADLWKTAWQWRDVPADASARPRLADDAARGEMESLVLSLMRQPDAGTLTRMSDFCADLAAGAAATAGTATGSGAARLTTFWQLAAATFEAQAHDLLAGDVYVKRVASRLLAQLRMGVRGQPVLSDRLAHDLLFFCSHATPPSAGHPAPRLAAVRKAWRLEREPTGDYETTSLGRFDPALVAAARKRVAGAKEVWAAVAGGDRNRLASLTEQFALVGDSTQRLFPHGEQLAQALQAAAAQTAAAGVEPAPTLAMEVATSILYLDACLEDGELEHPALAERVERMAERIHAVRAGGEAKPLETWMEELYRRVSDRQTMGSVVQELRVSLSDVEKRIDQYFRAPSDRDPLIPVPAQLSSMRGVLSVLGLSQASQAVLHMRHDVDTLAHTPHEALGSAQHSTFQRLADNLGALSFLIDMLSVQPALAKSLFKFDPVAGSLSAVMGQAERHSGFGALEDTGPLQPPTSLPAVPLLEQVQSLGQALRAADVRDDEVLPRLERLSQMAAAADEPELARTLSGARVALRNVGDTATRRGLLDELAAGLQSLGPALASPPPMSPMSVPLFVPDQTPAATAAAPAFVPAFSPHFDLAPALTPALTPAVTPAIRPAIRPALTPTPTTAVAPAPTAAFAPAVAAAPVPALAATPAVPDSARLDEDAELREIFIEEAREVVADARAALERLSESAESAADFTVLRRAFHTLKGSGRMVGLRDYGEAAWACEQLYNARLAAPAAHLDAALGQFTNQALDYLAEWAEAIAESRDGGHRSSDVVTAADALRLDGDRQGANVSTAANVRAPAPLTWRLNADELASRVPNLPSASDLDLGPPTSGRMPLADEPLPAAATALIGDFAPQLANGPAPASVSADEADAEAVSAVDGAAVPAAHDAAETADLTTTLFEPRFELDLASFDTPAAALLAVPNLPVLPASTVPGPASRRLEPHVLTDELSATELTALDTSWLRTPDGPADEPAVQLPAPASAAAVEAAAAAAAAGAGAPAVPAAEALALDLDFETMQGLFTPADVPAGTSGLAASLGEAAPADADAGAGAGAGAVADAAADADADAKSKVESTASADSKAQAAADAAAAAEEAAFVAASAAASSDEEPVRVIGPLRIGIPLFNIFLNEADELSRRLGIELAEWAIEHHQRPMADSTIALAHSLAGSSATVGYSELSALARALEHALMRSQAAGPGRAGEPALFNDCADEIRRLLHQFAAGFLRPVVPELLDRLADQEHWPVPASADDLAEAAAEVGSEHQYPHEPVTDLEPEALPSWMAVADDAAEPLGDLASAVAQPPDWQPPDSQAPPFAAAGVVPPEAAPVFGLEPPLAFEPEPEPQPRAELEQEPKPMPEPRLIDPVVALPVVAPLFAPSFAALPGQLPSVAAPHARADAFDDDQDIDAEDSIDTELFPIFEEEADELLPQLQSRLRDWVEHPGDLDAPSACMRTLHTFKGGARLAGAMRLGEMAHRLETAIEHLVARPALQAAELEPLLGRADNMSTAFAALRKPEQPVLAAGAVPLRPLTPAPLPTPVLVPVPVPAPTALPRLLPVPAEPEPAAYGHPVDPPAMAAPVLGLAAAAAAAGLVASSVRGAATPAPQGAMSPAEPLPAQADTTAAAPLRHDAAAPPPAIDWARFAQGDSAALPATDRSASGGGAVRVRAGLLDRLVNQAGEMSITRARIDADVRVLQGSLGELTESLDRMRKQLRDIELQAESQISSRMEAAKASSQSFDPLEMDRFTRFQELTRFMAESVNDVATVQRSLQRTLQSTEDELASQARLTRGLQDDLLRTRMVEFESMADRLYRTVRQAAKDTGKQVRLDIIGGAIEIDRGVLERMTGPFEHLLRNSVAHGIEPAAQRLQQGKDADGRISVQVSQSGNEVAVEIGDDGAGLDLGRIRQRGIEKSLLDPGHNASDAELAQLIFNPGFSTVDAVTELAGRGVGMDVVRTEVNAMGGRIETASTPGQGTRFRLVLPLTTAVTQVVMLRCGVLSVAVPSILVEVVRRVPSAGVEAAYSSGTFEFNDEPLPFFWLAALLQAGSRGDTASRAQTVVIIRSASQRVALHVDEVVGNQEVVVKNVGSQLARLPGLVGVTLLPSGVVSLIYNPVALASVYAESARQALRLARAGPLAGNPADAAVTSDALSVPRLPLVMVVDDSLTVRRVTQRLLVREGYRVTLAKDGLEALERLAEERPVVLLSDIEMPRMDGFDLLRNVRADERLAGLPVVMITSRIAQKHHDYAIELGVDHYLGKPYSEELLLSLVARYARAEASSTAGAA